MAHHSREIDYLNVVITLVWIFIGLPMAVAIVLIVFAGCYTSVWHVGNWVGWW